MNADAIQAPARRKLSSFRRVVVAVLAVTGILLGLTALHSMTASPAAAQSQSEAQAQSQSQSVLHDHAATAELGTTPLAQACDEMCQMNCLLVGVACTFAVLTAVVGLLLARPAARSVEFSAFTRIIRVLAQRLAVPRPPSLVVLSICRT